MFGPAVKEDCRVQIILESVLVEECIHMHPHDCQCSTRGRGDEDLDLLLNNSRRLHSSLDAHKGRSTELALWRHICALL